MSKPSMQAIVLEGTCRDVCGQQHVTCKLSSASALACPACCSLQAPITECRPPVALQFHEWPTFARRTPPTTILALLSPHYCLHTHAPSPSASASASRIISTACSFPHRPCPALAQGFHLLAPGFALRPLTHLLFPKTPAATFYFPPAMRAACT